MFVNMNLPLLNMVSKLVCHSRELLQQFIMDDPRGNRKGTYHVIMHPYTLHSLAKGHTLKYFEPHLKLSSLKVCCAMLCFVFYRLSFFLGSACLQAASGDRDSQWRGWPLPWCRDVDNMPDVNAYGQDCIAYVKLLMKVSGMSRAEPRMLPSMAQASQLRSREDRRGVVQQG